jgi:hypothetical protein
MTDGEVRRTSFTSVLTQGAGDAVRRSLANPKALYAIDPELVPFYCPWCDAVYCGRHWRCTLPPGIRGICPEGHERLLEE